MKPFLKKKSRATLVNSLISSASPGATLLELAVSIAISGVMFIILGAVFLAQGQFFAIENAIAETQVEAFRIADEVGGHASSAEAVVASRSINGTAYTTSDTLVILKIPSIDNSDEIIAGVDDHVAIGQDPDDPGRFIVDLDADDQSARADLTRRPSSLVDKVIIRYNTVDETHADVIDLYVRTRKDARGNPVVMPLGRTYFLGSSS